MRFPQTGGTNATFAEMQSIPCDVGCGFFISHTARFPYGDFSFRETPVTAVLPSNKINLQTAALFPARKSSLSAHSDGKNINFHRVSALSRRLLSNNVPMAAKRFADMESLKIWVVFLLNVSVVSLARSRRNRFAITYWRKIYQVRPVIRSAEL